MGPTWNPARRQKTGLWESGEGAEGCAPPATASSKCPPTCGRIPQLLWTGGSHIISSNLTSCVVEFKVCECLSKVSRYMDEFTSQIPRYDPSQGKVLSALHVLQAAVPELVGFLLKGSAPISLSNSFSASAS